MKGGSEFDLALNRKRPVSSNSRVYSTLELHIPEFFSKLFCEVVPLILDCNLESRFCVSCVHLRAMFNSRHRPDRGHRIEAFIKFPGQSKNAQLPRHTVCYTSSAFYSLFVACG
jgi:hypothetical protein